jgi:hypothetical protein
MLATTQNAADLTPFRGLRWWPESGHLRAAEEASMPEQADPRDGEIVAMCVEIARSGGTPERIAAVVARVLRRGAELGELSQDELRAVLVALQRALQKKG